MATVVLGEFEWDSVKARANRRKHGVSFEEAMECFFADFEIRRNKSYRDRYQLIEKTILAPLLHDRF